MDPLSILSIAAAVVAFVDFGGKLVGAAWDHLKRDDADDVTTGLADLARDSSQLGRLGRQIGGAQRKLESSAASRNPEFEAVLVDVARESALVSKSVEDLVLTLQANNENRKNASLGRHLLITVKGGESEYATIEKSLRNAEQRLGRINSTMVSAVLACLWYVADSKSMAQDIQNISLYLGQGNGPATPSPPPEPDKGASVSAEDRRRQQLIHQIWSQSPNPLDQHALGVDVEADLSATLPLAPPSQVELLEAILRSLWSDVMEVRRGGISPAHEKTFRWVFEHPQNTNNGSPEAPPWATFVSWLEKGTTEKIYWITGKPGSGKSTLMKYIIENERLEDHLQQWAGSGNLKVAVFYSWNAGADEQRSETGLLKSILYQYLTQMPELVPAVCPRRWAMHRVFGTRNENKLPPWSTTELRQAFDMLLPLARGSNNKLALFIDGLDEFQVADKFKFLLSFAEMVRAGGAKVCVSSREWTVFSDCFRLNPSLRLQDLTRGDIERYIRGHLDQSVAYEELRDSDAAGLDGLVASMLNKASGVFLWVRLVTEVVLDRIEAGATVRELNQRIEELPPDLGELYRGIWDKLGPQDQTSVARLISILEASGLSLSATTMFAAEQPDAEEAVKTPKDALTRLVTRRLRSQTRGLLELSDTGAIDYLHRTARDWALAMEDEMKEMLPPDFDPNLQLFMATVAIQMTPPTPTSWTPSFDRFFSCLGQSLQHASRVVLGTNNSVNHSGKLFATLDRLDNWAAETCKASVQSWRALIPGGSGDSSGNEPDIIHWSSYMHHRRFVEPAYSNTLLGMACQYGMLEYVEQKLEACPGMVRPKRNEVSLLENALFIDKRSTFGFGWIRPSEEDMIARLRRQDALIRLLLAHGADPRAESVWLSHDPDIFHCFILYPPDAAGLRANRRKREPRLPLYKIVPEILLGTKPVFSDNVRVMFDENLKNQGKSRGKISRLRAKLLPL
ncbi:hypothetical protein C8A05DRAFT_20316 [Staphylotrichum tortipilum]|uniref:Nephrocystin 3-like N-terminal domain-containing protein n=1 Tax=Staphylotrichum tortipilum TaxID=2831512 RepID=A0AAN6MB38_9PEZI|nr:hypothetical protein C8A05DRAFT_20316 [Staphylotrichum longicolle]